MTLGINSGTHLKKVRAREHARQRQFIDGLPRKLEGVSQPCAKLYTILLPDIGMTLAVVDDLDVPPFVKKIILRVNLCHGFFLSRLRRDGKVTVLACS